MVNWSPEKAAYCCSTERLGCTASEEDKASTRSYDCTVTRSEDVQVWSFSRRSWCCQKKDVGCPSAVHAVGVTAAPTGGAPPSPTFARPRPRPSAQLPGRMP